MVPFDAIGDKALVILCAAYVICMHIAAFIWWWLVA